VAEIGAYPDEKVKQMVFAVPTYTVGDQVHAIFVNKAAGSTPGDYKKEIRTAEKDARFVDIFFPGWSALPYTNDVAGRTGLDDRWWSEFAVALLCQAMCKKTSQQTRRSLKEADIDKAVIDANTELHAKAAAFYSHVLTKSFSDFAAQFNAIDDHRAAKDQYIRFLKESVPIQDVWFASNLYKNPDWPLFHHYMKLMALGASVDEINTLNSELKTLGLPMPPDIDNGKWTGFTGYLLNHPQVTHADIGEQASNGILRPVEIYWTKKASNHPEYYSTSFLRDGPGRRFRRS